MFPAYAIYKDRNKFSNSSDKNLIFLNFLVCRSFFRVFFRTIMGRRDELIPADQAALTRDIVKSLDEPLVYPESRQELEKAIQEHSLGHNPQVYPEQPSGRKDIPEFSVVQKNGGKTKLPKAVSKRWLLRVERCETVSRNTLTTPQQERAVPATRNYPLATLMRSLGTFTGVACDVNGDGNITAVNITTIYNMILD